MKRPLIIAAGVLALGAAGILSMMAVSPISAQSASTQVATVETETFAIENMTCALCPVTVKKAMQGVDGVRSVDIDFDAKTATVAFDPALTNADTIAAASTNAGYPASLRG
ncbi:cation transporter [uncultured Parvibaculum sp.]|uniref:heavy-metal-associated domain-containing protein n=1 Tax=uncultured Parvibaculum sp. TaxID=291828 RepID=UPI0030DD0C6E|tara:strand:+ start:58060 stop:58392 length:333 start_codon:yes stop_codon:yes gene_type:complete